MTSSLPGPGDSHASMSSVESIKNGDDMHSLTGLHVRRSLWRGYRKAKKKASSVKRAAKASLIDLSKPIRDQVMMAVKEVLRSSMADDPDLCRTARRWLSDVVEEVWKDVTSKVDESVKEARDSVHYSKTAWMDREDLKTKGEEPPRWSFLQLRAFILYHQMPYDKSIFGNFRDPWYWVIALPSFIPDVRVIYYIVILACINFPGPPDEYQLVQFILCLKAVQFLTSGIGLAFVGGIQYSFCITEGPNHTMVHTCDKDGPGSVTSIPLGIIDTVGLCVLIWWCFTLLPYSRRSGGLRRESFFQDPMRSGNSNQSGVGHTRSSGSRSPPSTSRSPPEGSPDSNEAPYDAASNHTVHSGGESEASGSDEDWFDETHDCCVWVIEEEGRGGRLKGFLRYDLKCFIAYLCFMAVIGAKHWHKDRAEHIGVWELQSALYWARVFYSFLGLPFFVFALPVFSSLFTHTVPTGYNQNGTIVPFSLPPCSQPVTVITRSSNHSNVPLIEDHARQEEARARDTRQRAGSTTSNVSLNLTSIPEHE